MGDSDQTGYPLYNDIYSNDLEKVEKFAKESFL